MSPLLAAGLLPSAVLLLAGTPAPWSGPGPGPGPGLALVEVVGSDAETGWWMIRVSDGDGTVSVLAPGPDPGPVGVVVIPADLLFFEIGSSAVGADDAAVLDQVAGLIIRAGQPVTVVGHTDDTGPEAYNRELGAARAGAVRHLLIEGGVPPELVADVESQGETCPVQTNHTPGGRAANRRVEIILPGFSSPCPPDQADRDQADPDQADPDQEA